MSALNVIETARLFLTPWTAADVDGFHGIWGDERVVGSGRHHGDLGASRIELDGWLESIKDLPRGLGRWAVCLRDARTIIGDVGLRPSSSNSEDIEITYHFASNHWGQGYATEAAQAVVNYGTELLGLPRILANVPTDHHAAARVVEKLGFAKGSPVGVTGSKHLEYLYEAVLEPEVWEPESGF